MANFLTFGCPVYESLNDLQNNNEGNLSIWQPRVILSINLGLSPSQTRLVGLELNLQTDPVWLEFYDKYEIFLRQSN